MAEINDLNTVDASNIDRFPEGQAPSTLNDGARALEGIIARGNKDALESSRDSTGTATAYLVAANRTLTAYYDGLRIGFHAHLANTGPATLDVDAIGAKSIKKHHDRDLSAGDIGQHQYVDVIYSASDDTWQMQTPSATAVVTDLPQTFTATQTLSKGADLGDTDIDVSNILTLGGDGNSFDIAGTQQIDGIATVGVGTTVRLHFDTVRTLTHNATDLILPGGVDITTAVGDIADLQEYATADWRCVNYQRASGLAVTSGIIQVATQQTGAVATGTTQIPLDDTIPQITEGTQFLEVTITPTSTTNALLIEIDTMFEATASGTITVGLFQDSTANALAAIGQGFSAGAANIPHNIKLRHLMAAGTASATTFRLRAGLGAPGTITLNGVTGARRLGGVAASSITATEYAVALDSQ